MEHFDLFCEVLDLIPEDGLTLTFTPKNVAYGDHFLIFSAYKSCTCHFRRTWSGIVIVDFDDDEPMLLENCPDTFFESIIKVAKEGAKDSEN